MPDPKALRLAGQVVLITGAFAPIEVVGKLMHREARAELHDLG